MAQPQIPPDASSSLALWLGKPVPRYTSYPPAPAFREGIAAAEYARSIAAIPDNESISLYIHIPFCKELCLYCGCNTTITRREDRIAGYLDALKREIAAVSALSAAHRRVSHLHFGGGTPNILSDSQIHALFDCLNRHFGFAADGEIAVELDPRTVTREQARTLAACGVTRASLGVQDFDGDVQALVNRVQPYDRVAEVCEWLRSAGVTGVNFDLMYGLPKQTTSSVAATAGLVCSLQPDRLALFSYAHVPQMKKHQMALVPHGIPGDSERLDMDGAARAVFREFGYAEIGMDHFALPGDSLAIASAAGNLRRNFQGYTTDTARAILALGASSISETPDGYFQNERDENAYQDLIASGRLAVRRGLLTTDEDRLRAAIIERLMCDMKCDVEKVCREHDEYPQHFDDAFAALRPYEDAGLIARNGYAIRLTSPYRMAIRVVCRAFDAYTPGAPGASSRAA